ncbi:RHS repeat-associated core domain-containing protein [Streptomyces sp. NPDC096030]|uniref:RHS repeat protein n=1 Tax=Streptomyces sp. NPDC096030 TaxID=3155423 RepID=UPI00331C4330
MTLIRDAAGRVTEERRPDGTKTVFAYTPGGEVAQAVSPSGIRTAYEYDGATGQVLQVTAASPDGKTSEKTGYSYDPHTGGVTAVFDPGDTGGTRISYTYDADGHVTEVAYPDGKTVRQTYGDDGLLEKTTDTAGLTTFYTYNPDGTLAEAVQHERDDTQSPVKARVAFTYDGLGRIIKTGRGNGVVTETEFTSAHQIRHEKTTRDGKTLTEASYTYDSHNNLTQRTDTRPEASPDGTPGGPVTTTTRYTYDAYDRLTGSEVLDAAGKPLTTTRYELNVSGDVVKTETTPRNGQTTVTENSIDPTGRLTHRTTTSGETSTGHKQAFDADGNLTTGHDGTSWSYGLHGRPATVTTPDGSVTRYTYWADGTRATATAQAGTALAEGSGPAPEETSRFYYTPGGTLANDTHTTSTGGQGAATASYLLAGARHARTLTGSGAGGAERTGAGYLIADRHGNTTALTTSDGTVSQAWQYTDYGQPAGPDGAPVIPPAAPADGQPAAPAGAAGAARQPFTFAGEYTDPHGTQYLKTRLYDPGTGRFTTPDPAPRHNRYQAMGTNPVTSIDPDGTTEIPDWQNWLVTGLSAFLTAVSAVATAVSFGIAAPVTLMGMVLGGASAALEIASTAAQSLSKPRHIITALHNAALALSLADLPAGAVSSILTAGRLAGKMGMKGAIKTLQRTQTTLATEDAKGDIKHIAHMHQQVLDNAEGNVCVVTTIACIKNLRAPMGNRIDVSATESMRWISHTRMQQLSKAAGKWSAPMNAQDLRAFFRAKKDGPDSYKMYIVSVRNSRLPGAVYAFAGPDVPTHYFPVVTSRNIEGEGLGNPSSYALDLDKFYRISTENLEAFDAREFRVLDVGSVDESWFKGLRFAIK